MADSIGSNVFISLTGELGYQQPILQDISREGVPGVAYRQMPDKGKETTLTGIAYFTDATAANNAGTNYAQLTGTLQTITWGNIGSQQNYLVLEVRALVPKFCYVSGANAWRVDSYWRVRYGST